MDKLTKLKTAVLLACSSLVLGAQAAEDTTTSATATTNTAAPTDNSTPATTTPTTATDTTTTPSDSTTTTTTTTTATPTANDASIQTAVQSALSNYNTVTVAVSGGVVTLSGQLESDTDYDKVITTAQSMDGVSDVNADNLTVKDSTQPLTDSYITAKIKGSLLKSDIMGKDIPSWSVSVETKNGEVFLSGTIATDTEKQNILSVVKSVKGVNQVHDEIQVSPAANTQESDSDNNNNNNDQTSD